MPKTPGNRPQLAGTPGETEEEENGMKQQDKRKANRKRVAEEGKSWMTGWSTPALASWA